MQVQFGDRTFIKTKYDGLDGNTTVAFKREDDKVEGRAKKTGVILKVDIEAFTYQQLRSELASVLALCEQLAKEHEKMRPKLTTSLTGH